MSWIKPITDRTFADVISARDGDPHSPCIMNASDWNRIEDNISYIADEMYALGDEIVITAREQPYGYSDIPTVSDIRDIIHNLHLLAASSVYDIDETFTLPDEISTTADMYLTFELINSIESATLELYSKLKPYHVKIDDTGMYLYSRSLPQVFDGFFTVINDEVYGFDVPDYNYKGTVYIDGTVYIEEVI